VKRSNRRNNVSSKRSVVVASLATLALLSPFGCRQSVDGDALTGKDACAALDSLLASVGPSRPDSMAGTALVDVEGFRFRGHFRLVLAAGGEAQIELSGSTLFGGHREDVLVSLAADTLRVFDRERGRFYEGESLDQMVLESTHARGNWSLVAAQVLAGRLPCGAIESLTPREDGASGRAEEATYRIVVGSSGRIERATWPDPVMGGTFDDRLEVRYVWQGDSLREITASLPTRGWRVRLTSDK
jgi:hypothetical protein